MRCWQCEQEARAVCNFCGRFVCKDHASTMPSFLAMFLGGQETPKAVVVADVIWCTICDPQPEPIGMPELY